MLRYVLILCLVHISRQGNEGWHPVGGDPVIGPDGMPTELVDDDVVASGWYAEESDLYTSAEIESDAEGFHLFNDSNILNYTYGTHNEVVYHFHSKNPKERAGLTAVRKILKSLATTEYQMGTPVFGMNNPSIKMQEKLKMTKVPCLAIHRNHEEVVYYTGKMERQGISDFIATVLGKVHDDEGVPLTMEKGVFVVNKSNYNKFINGPIFAMLYFYEEGCSACSATFPAFENLMKKYNHTEDQVWLGQYKTSKIEALLSYNITSLPAITYGMMGGQRFIYKRSFDQFSLEMFITTQMVFDESQFAIQLTADRFYSFIKLKPVVIVKFFKKVGLDGDLGYPDPKKFAAWSVMAQQWDHPVVFATVNTTQHKLRDRELQEMSDHSDIVMYKWGNLYRLPFEEYNINKDYAMLNLISWRISQEVKDSEIREMRDTKVEDTILLGVFPGKSDNSEIYRHYERTVLKYNKRADLIVLHSYDGDTAARFKVTSPSIVLLYPAESVTVDKATPNYKVIPITMSDKVEDLANRIYDLCHNSTHFPLIASTDYTGLDFTNPFYTKHLVTIYLPLDWSTDNWSNMNHWTQKIKPLAIHYKKKGLIFVYADEETSYDVIQDLGIREGTISELIFTITHNELQRVFYPKVDEYEGRPFIEVLKTFLDKYITGQLYPQIRSQKEVPIAAGKLATVVGSNAEQFMVPDDETLAVTLLFHEHSQEVLNAQLLMELLAEKYAHIPTLQFGKLELARNDLFFKATPTNQLVFSDRYKAKAYKNKLDECAGSLIDFELCITEHYAGKLYSKDDPKPVNTELTEEVEDIKVILPTMGDGDVIEPARYETGWDEPKDPVIEPVKDIGSKDEL